MVINRKVGRTIMSHKAPYIGSIILITLSCLIFSLFTTVGSNLDRNNQAFKKDYAQEDAHFTVQQPLDRISELEKRYDVRIEKRLSFDEDLGGGKTLRFMTPGKQVNRPYIEEGKPIEGERDMLIDKNFAQAHGFVIGDTYSVDGQNFKITGYLMVPDYVYVVQSLDEMIADSNRFGIAALSPRAFEALGRGTPSYSVTFAKGADRSAFRDTVNERYRLTDWLEANENPRIVLIDQDIQSLIDMTGALSVVILLMTCTLIGIVIWRTLKQEFVQIGTLHALGYKKAEILRHYLTYAWIVSFSGSILGTLLGIAAVRPMLGFYNSYYNVPSIHMNWNIPVLFISLIIPAVFLVPVVCLIVSRALRMTPMELMRGGRAKTKVGFLEKHVNPGRLRFGNKFRVRELIRNIPRTLLLLFGIVFASILLLLGFGIYSSMNYLVKDESGKTAHYEYNYLYSSPQTAKEEEGEPYSVYTFSPSGEKRTLGNSYSVYGIDTASDYLNFEDDNGKRLSLDQTLITRPLADKLDIRAGDSIKAKNALDDKTYTIEINRIAEVYTENAIYMPYSVLNDMLGYPSSAHNGVFSNRKLPIDPDRLASTTSIEENKKRMESFLAPMQGMFGIMSSGAFVIGLIVIFVVTSLIIEENRETISMLKVFGYRNREIYRLVLSSNTIIVMLGYLLAIPLLIWLLGALFRFIGESANFALPVRISGWSFLIGFTIIFLAYGLAQWSGRRKISRISLSEILKSRME